MGAKAGKAKAGGAGPKNAAIIGGVVGGAVAIGAAVVYKFKKGKKATPAPKATRAAKKPELEMTV